MTPEYEKQKTLLRGILEGAGMYRALQAMKFGESRHTGIRKDGKPEFSHQIAMGLHARCFFPFLEDPEEVVLLIMLHDIFEDELAGFDELASSFGEKSASRCVHISKVRNGQKLSNDVYYSDLHTDPTVSVAKGFDRAHNLSTMFGAFEPRKMLQYLQETRQHTLPMLKLARQTHVRQMVVYEAIKHTINLSLTPVDYFLSHTPSSHPADSAETIVIPGE